MKAKILVVLAALGLVALIAYRVTASVRANKTVTERPAEATVIETVRVGRASVPQRVALTGSVKARNDVDVFPKIAGRIESVSANVGDRVKAGHLLATIEHKEIAWQAKAAAAARDVARAGLDGAKLEFDRTELLFKAQAAPQAALDGARVKLQLAQAQLAQAEAAAGLAEQQVANARIESPIAGAIIRRPINVGAQVGPQGPAFAVQDVGTLKLESSVDAATFARLRRGTPAVVTIDVLPGESFPGEVSLLSPALDPQSRRAAVEIQIDNARGRLLPNMFAHVDVTIGKLDDALVVPQEALLEAAGGQTIFRVRGGKAEAVRPRLGPGDGKRVVVLSGLAEGDEVAVTGVAVLSDGAPVKVASALTAERAP